MPWALGVWAQRLDQSSATSPAKGTALLLIGWRLPSHSVPTQGPSPAGRRPLRMLRVAGRGPLSSWTQGLGLGGAPASPALVSSPVSPPVFLAGAFVAAFMWSCACPPPQRHTAGAQRAAPLSPQTLPRRSSGLLEEGPGPGARPSRGHVGASAGAPALQTPVGPPAPAFLARRMRRLVSIFGVGRSEGSGEIHLPLPTQLHPHVGSVLLPSFCPVTADRQC